jgi:glutamate-1-semialdehyde 2,1-aminomutase
MLALQAVFKDISTLKMTTSSPNQPTSSEALFDRATRVMPGGVNSPVRAFHAVGGTPVFVERGHGSRIVTADGRELLDFCGSWGPLILGHAHKDVVQAVSRAAANGTSFGTSTRGEVELAELLCRQVPYFDRVRLVNSGTEAVMTALRLARAHTGRDKILKFDGCYHGHSDNLLVSAGSGLLTHGLATSAGIPKSALKETLVAPYNDVDAVEQIADRHGDDLAAIIVEPVAGNMGLVAPNPDFLQGLRRIADHCGALLVFDEVITGFRLGPTTYGTLQGVTPDLTCLGKIIGGGMPIGAVGGPAGVMDRLAPVGEVYQAGTLSGNPVAVASGLATLNALLESNPYPQLTARATRIRDAVTELAKTVDFPLHCAQHGGMFTVFFAPSPVGNKSAAGRSNTELYAKFFHAMQERGVYLPPSQFEVAFISAAHTDEDIQYFIETMNSTMQNLNTGVKP